MTQFNTFQTGAVWHLKFSKRNFWRPMWQRGSNCIITPNFEDWLNVLLQRNHAKWFSRWWPMAIRHPWFVICVFGPPTRIQRAFDGLYHCAKFGRNWPSSFDNMLLSYLASLAWKCLFMPPSEAFYYLSGGTTITKLVIEDLRSEALEIWIPL